MENSQENAEIFASGWMYHKYGTDRLDLSRLSDEELAELKRVPGRIPFDCARRLQNAD